MRARYCGAQRSRRPSRARRQAIGVGLGQHDIEQHQALDGTGCCGATTVAIVDFADGTVEVLAMEVEAAIHAVRKGRRSLTYA